MKSDAHRSQSEISDVNGLTDDGRIIKPNIIAAMPIAGTIMLLKYDTRELYNSCVELLGISILEYFDNVISHL